MGKTAACKHCFSVVRVRILLFVAVHYACCIGKIAVGFCRVSVTAFPRFTALTTVTTQTAGWKKNGNLKSGVSCEVIWNISGEGGGREGPCENLGDARRLAKDSGLIFITKRHPVLTVKVPLRLHSNK